MGVLLLVRHGQATLGTADYDQLSDLGREQAGLVGARLSRFAPAVTRVACGSLVRQRDTAQAVAERCAIPAADVVRDDRLDEYDHIGVLAAHTDEVTFEGAATPEAHAKVQPALEQAIARWRTSGADGYAETHQAFVERVLAAVGELAQLPGTTVVSTSGGCIGVVTAHLLGRGADDWPEFARVTVNASVTKVLSGRSGLTLATFNDHAHLEHDRALITYR